MVKLQVLLKCLILWVFELSINVNTFFVCFLAVRFTVMTVF